MGGDFDPLETAEACADTAEHDLIRDIEDIISSYGAHAFIQCTLKSSAGEAMERIGMGAGQVRAIAWVLSEIIEAQRPRLVAECVSLAAGLFSGKPTTMTQIAKRYGMSRANVSRMVLRISDRLGMQPSAAMKPASCRETYGMTNGATKKQIQT